MSYPDSSSSRAAAAHGEAAAAAARRVLVADDDPDNAESLALLLRLDGHEVRVAHSGDEALKVAQDFEPEFAFLDIGMPGLDGYALGERLRALRFARRPTLVAVTGWGHDEDRRRALAAGYDRHLVKPVDPEVISDLLR